jgi:hypothetical protein
VRRFNLIVFLRAVQVRRKQKSRKRSFPILPFIIIIVIILVLVSKTKAVAEIQETVVVVDQVYWIS